MQRENGMAKYILQPILQKRKKSDSELVTAPDLQCKSRRSCQRLGLHAAAYHTKGKDNKKISGTDITLQMQKNVLMSTYIPLILRFRVRKDLRKNKRVSFKQSPGGQELLPFLYRNYQRNKHSDFAQTKNNYNKL